MSSFIALHLPLRMVKNQFEQMLMIENILPALEKLEYSPFSFPLRQYSMICHEMNYKLIRLSVQNLFFASQKYDCEKVILESSYKNRTGLRPRDYWEGDQNLAPKLNNLIKKDNNSR